MHRKDETEETFAIRHSAETSVSSRIPGTVAVTGVITF
jgi:hypothetical protein